MFAPRVTISTAFHDYHNQPMNIRAICKPVVVGNDLWFGIGATVLVGVHIEDGAMISAHALVTKDVLANAIVIGRPGEVVGHRP